MRFDGSDYDPKFDKRRLEAQHEKIKTLMVDSLWRTLFEISAKLDIPESSASAQLRHLRKKRFGSFVVEKRVRGKRESGLFEYRVSPAGTVSVYAMKPRASKLKMIVIAMLKHPDTTTSQKEVIKKIIKR